MRDAVVMFVAVLSSIFGVKLGKSTGDDAQHVVDILVSVSILAIWLWATYLCMLRAARYHGNRGAYYCLFYPLFCCCVGEICATGMVVLYGTEMSIYMRSGEVGVGSLFCMWLWGTLEELRSALSKAIRDLLNQPHPTWFSAKKPRSRPTWFSAKKPRSLV